MQEAGGGGHCTARPMSVESLQLAWPQQGLDGAAGKRLLPAAPNAGLLQVFLGVAGSGARRSERCQPLL